MARLAGAGEVAGSTGRHITPAAIPDECRADYWLDEIGDEHGMPRLDRDDECLAAYGHTADEMRAGHSLNPFAGPHVRPSPLDARVRHPWPHWRSMLAAQRAGDAFDQWCADHKLLDDKGRAPREFLTAQRHGSTDR